MQATEILIMTSLTSLSKTILFQTIENKALKYNQGIELETQEIKSQITILQKQLDSLKHRQDMFLDSLVSGALSTVERKAITKRLEELEIEEKTITCKRINARTNEAIVKYGTEKETVRDVLAADGKTITRTITGTDTKGQQLRERQIYEKQDW